MRPRGSCTQQASATCDNCQYGVLDGRCQILALMVSLSLTGYGRNPAKTEDSKPKGGTPYRYTENPLENAQRGITFELPEGAFSGRLLPAMSFGTLHNKPYF